MSLCARDFLKVTQFRFAVLIAKCLWYHFVLDTLKKQMLVHVKCSTFVASKQSNFLSCASSIHNHHHHHSQLVQRSLMLTALCTISRYSSLFVAILHSFATLSSVFSVHLFWVFLVRFFFACLPLIQTHLFQSRSSFNRYTIMSRAIQRF